MNKARVHRWQMRQLIALVIGVLLVSVATYAYFAHLGVQGDATLVFKNPDGSSSRQYHIEIARTRGEQEKGLMYRKHMESDQGMAFPYEEEKVQRFWMHNTYIPLDMLFIDRSNRVVGILHDVPVLNDDPRTINAPSRVVVELNAGSSQQDHIVEGSVAEFHPAL